jgi:hypothetical protein
LSDRETIRLLPEHPWLKLDSSAKATLVKFSKRHEKRSDLSPRDDLYYNIVAKDYNNDAETKAIREFLNTKLTDPNQEITEFKYPGTSHVIGWGNVQLSDTAKAEVGAYEGVKGIVEDMPVEYDRAVTSNKPPASHSFRGSKLSRMVRAAYNGVAKHAAFVKRAVTWVKQQNAGWDLVMVSQPK